MDAATSWLASQVRVMQKQVDKMNMKVICLEESMRRHEEIYMELNPNAMEFVPLDKMMELCSRRSLVGLEKLQDIVENLMRDYVVQQPKIMEGFQVIEQKVVDLHIIVHKKVEKLVFMNSHAKMKERIQTVTQKVEELHKIVSKEEKYHAQNLNDEIGQSTVKNLWAQEQCTTWEDKGSSTWSQGWDGFLETMDWRAISVVSTFHYRMATEWLQAGLEQNYG